MSGKRDREDAFDILNQEFANVGTENNWEDDYDSFRENQPSARRNAYDVQDDDAEDNEQNEGRGCVGTVLRLLLILILAAALAWVVFMPQGSLEELWNKILPGSDNAASWFSALFAGTPSDGSGQDGTSSAPAADTSSRDMSASQGSVSSEPSQGEMSQDTSYSITVYRPSQIVIVYDAAGNPAKVFSCSSGKSSTPTQLGDYAIRAKYRWRYMVGDCYTQYASSFSSGYLFHSIPYNKKNPGTMSNSSYDMLGNPASSGCIRLCFRDTKWIYDNCPVGTQVHVVDENAPAGSVPDIIPERIKDNAHNGWDPTDESPDSPYSQ